MNWGIASMLTLVFGGGLVLGSLIGANQQTTVSVIRIGQGGPCTVDIDTTVWPEMNEMGVYRWVAACEKSNELEAQQP